MDAGTVAVFDPTVSDRVPVVKLEAGAPCPTLVSVLILSREG
jgi:hypothetical protein